MRDHDRTIQFISQTTITQREVESNPDLNPAVFGNNSIDRGPGFVAPIGVGGHFPPGVQFTPQVDLFGIEHTNRDSFVLPGPDGAKGTADDVPINTRFDATYIPGQEINPPISYGEATLTLAQQQTPALNHYQARGIATIPGGIPLFAAGPSSRQAVSADGSVFDYGALVGGIGVFFPGTTGYADEENSLLGSNYTPTKPDRSLEAEFIGVAAAGGSSALGIPVGFLGPFAPVAGFDLPAPRIDLVGITLDVIGPGGTQGPYNLLKYARDHFNIGQGNINGGTFEPVTPGGAQFVAGRQVPSGYLVAPHAGTNITAAEVRQIIEQGIAEANLTRAQIRTPASQTARMVFAVADRVTNEVLGLYRMPDATFFSIDVAVAKARNTAYYDDPTQLQPQDQLPGVPAGISFTNRTFRYLAHPRFPISTDGSPPGPFSSLNDPGFSRVTALLRRYRHRRTSRSCSTTRSTSARTSTSRSPRPIAAGRTALSSSPAVAAFIEITRCKAASGSPATASIKTTSSPPAASLDMTRQPVFAWTKSSSAMCACRSAR